MTEAEQKKYFDISVLKRVFQFVKPYRWRFIISVILAIVLAGFTPIRPYLIQLTVDRGTGKNVSVPWFINLLFPGTQLSSAWQFVINITIFQVVFIFIETAARFYFSFITSWMGQSVVRDMRTAVYKKILSLNLKQFDTTPIGTLTTRTINDIESINDIFSDGLIPIFADLLSIIVVLVVMFVTDWQLTLIALIPFPFLIIATKYFKESVNKSFIQVRNAVAALNAFVQERITGMQIVQSFAAEDREMENFKKINRHHRSSNIHAIFAYSIFFPIVEIVLAVSTGLLVWWLSDKSASNPVLNGDLAGKLTAFILYLNLIFRPLRVIADKFNVIQMGVIAAERVFKVLDNPDVLPPSSEKDYAPVKRLNGKVEFDKVWFAYNEENYVLKDISFTVQPGETVAIVGHTGSGKTSIISLLNRLYQIKRGSIKLDDIEIEKYNVDTLRKNIAVVLQDVFLFSG
jgi:ATP-binding cassette subfamily B protein